MLCLPELSPGTGVVVAGAIAAAVGSLSWLGKSAVSGFLWYYGKRSKEIERMIALHAEISANLSFQRRIGAPAALDSMREALRANPRHKFFIPLYREDIVFDRLKTDITDLPADPIDEIIDYYNLSNGLDIVLERMETKRFEIFAAERRIKIVEAVSQMAIDTVTSGEAALRALSRQIHRSGVQKYALMGVCFFAAVIAATALFRIVDSIATVVAKCFAPA